MGIKYIESSKLEGLEPEDIEKIKVIGKPYVLESAIKFAMRLAPELGFSYNELLLTFGLRKGKHSKEMKLLALEWKNLSEEEKQEEINREKDDQVYFVSRKITPEILNEIAEKEIERNDKLLAIPVKVIEVLSGEKSKEFLGDFLEVLELATNVDREQLKETDWVLLLELFKRIVIKPKSALGESFLYTKIAEIFRTFSPISTILDNVKRKQSQLISKLEEES